MLQENMQREKESEYYSAWEKQEDQVITELSVAYKS